MKDFYLGKVREYKNYFFTIDEYQLAADLRNLEIILFSDSIWINWDEENFLNEIKKFCEVNKQDWILRDLKISLIEF